MSIVLKKKLKSLKEHFSLTTGDIAQKLNIGVDTFKSYEFGKILPPYEATITLSKIFGVSIDYLVFSDNHFINFLLLFYLAEKTNNLPNMDRSYIDDSVNQFIKTKKVTNDCSSVKFDNLEQYRLSNSIHDNIKLLREKNNLSQDKMAKLLNLSSKVSISQYEKKSKPPFEILKKMSLKFNLSVHYLLTGSPLIFNIEDNLLNKNLLIFDKVATLIEVEVITAVFKQILSNNNIPID